MGKFLKKNWFVALIVVIFTCISAYYIYDTNKGKLKGKTSDGEDVVYSVNDEDITASEFYDELYQSNGSTAVLTQFIKAVADQSYKTTEEIEEEAESQAESITSNYYSSYGSSYESYLASDLASTGYSTLTDYLITQIKLDKVTAEYAANHFDELQIREISYILISYEDSENITEEPTEDEQSRMDAVDEMLESGSSFADTAIEYSEDSSTAASGGVLGVIDVNSSDSLDSAFYEAAMALEEGEVSDWIVSEDYGYFKIMCNAATPESVEASENVTDPYESLVTTYDTTLETAAVWEKAESLGIDWKGNEDIEEEIKASFGVEDEEEEEETEEDAESTAESTAEAESAAEATATSGGDDE